MELRSAAERHAADGDGAKLVCQQLARARCHEPEDFERKMGRVITAFQYLMCDTPVADAVTVSRGAMLSCRAAPS